MIVLGLIYHIAYGKLFFEFDIAGSVCAADQHAVSVIQLDHRQVHVLAIMIDSDDIVLVQRSGQRDFVHASAKCRYGSNLIAVIVGFVDVGQVFRVFVKQIAFGKGSIEGLFQIVFFFRGNPIIQSLSVFCHYICHIRRLFHPAFYFQGIDFFQIRNTIDGVEIFGGQQIAASQRFSRFSVEKLIRLAAGAYTSAPVSAAVSDQSRHQTVAGIGHAQRAVDKDFKRNLRGLSDFLNCFDGYFSRKHYTVCPHLLKKQRAF